MLFPLSHASTVRHDTPSISANAFCVILRDVRISTTLTAGKDLFLAKVSKANSDQKLQKLEESHLKSDELLKNISEMSEKMQTGINEIYNELAKLNEAGKATQSTMEVG